MDPPLKHLGAITSHLKPDRTVGMAPVLASSQEWKWLHHLSTMVEALRDCDCAGVHLWGCGTASPHPPSLTFILFQCIPLCAPSLFVPPSLGLQLLQWAALPGGCTEQRTVLT